ncbi:MAG: hypothetical protein R3B45_07680 [Bdellovibrionota bacterium]
MMIQTTTHVKRLLGLVALISFIVVPAESKILCISKTGDHIAVENTTEASHCAWSDRHVPSDHADQECPDVNCSECSKSGCTDIELLNPVLLGTKVSYDEVQQNVKKLRAVTLISQIQSFYIQEDPVSETLRSLSEIGISQKRHYQAIRSVIFLN